jgi:hypothetical protein
LAARVGFAYRSLSLSGASQGRSVIKSTRSHSASHSTLAYAVLCTVLPRRVGGSQATQLSPFLRLPGNRARPPPGGLAQGAMVTVRQVVEVSRIDPLTAPTLPHPRSLTLSWVWGSGARVAGLRIALAPGSQGSRWPGLRTAGCGQPWLIRSLRPCRAALNPASHHFPTIPLYHASGCCPEVFTAGTVKQWDSGIVRSSRARANRSPRLCGKSPGSANGLAVWDAARHT